MTPSHDLHRCYRIPGDWDILDKNLKYHTFQAAHILFFTLQREEEADLTNDLVEQKWGRQKFQALLHEMKESGTWNHYFSFRIDTGGAKTRYIVTLAEELRQAFEKGTCTLIPDHYGDYTLRHDISCDTGSQRESEKSLKRFLCQLFILIQEDIHFTGFQQTYLLHFSGLEAHADRFREASHPRRFLAHFPHKMAHFIECRKEGNGWQVRVKEPVMPKPFRVHVSMPATPWHLPQKLYERKLDPATMSVYQKAIDFLADDSNLKTIFSRPRFLEAFCHMDYLIQLPGILRKIFKSHHGETMNDIKNLISDLKSSASEISRSKSFTKFFSSREDTIRIYLAHHYLHLASNSGNGEVQADSGQLQPILWGTIDRALFFLLDDLGFRFIKERFLLKKEKSS